MKKITEGEITSMVRRFFRENGFDFLSTKANGEKLYYTVNENFRNKKQPDSIVYKEDLVIVCEDKIRFTSLFHKHVGLQNDYNKLVGFLNSEVDVYEFKMKVQSILPHKSKLNLIGSLASLKSCDVDTSYDFINNKLIYLSIINIDVSLYRVEAHIEDIFLRYFDKLFIDIEI